MKYLTVSLVLFFASAIHAGSGESTAVTDTQKVQQVQGTQTAEEPQKSEGPGGAKDAQGAKGVSGGYGFTPPLDISLLLSGNMGELRGNHFHSGVDFKTQGVIGKPVRAIAPGYVARISVSPGGFGKAIYINHPNGMTSVYGHVESFTPEIDRYVREEQYRRQSFPVELTLPADRFRFNQGDLVAYSGNRGSSGGPHLHFEVRETASQQPLNVIALKMFSLADNIAPRIATLYYIEVDTVRGIPVHTARFSKTVQTNAAGKASLSDTAALKVAPRGYFGIELHERKNGADNLMGAYKIAVRLDGRQVFGYTMDRMNFSLTRYAQAVTLFPQSLGKRNNVYRLAVLPNNPLPYYKGTAGRGVVALNDAVRHEVEIEVEDDAGNTSVLAFKVITGLAPRSAVNGGRGNGAAGSGPTGGAAADTGAKAAPGNGAKSAGGSALLEEIPVAWEKPFHLDGQGFTMDLPARALYESILLTTAAKPATAYAYSPLYVIHPPDVPLHSAMTLSIEAPDLPLRLRGKALLGLLGNTRTAVGGVWSNGRVTANVRSFGTFYVAVDTVAPRITPNFAQGENFQGKKSMSLIISDDFSGIASYKGTIDGQWALFEHDPKTKRITHVFDDTRPAQGTRHQLQVEVTDAKGNRGIFSGTFLR